MSNLRNFLLLVLAVFAVCACEQQPSSPSQPSGSYTPPVQPSGNTAPYQAQTPAHSSQKGQPTGASQQVIFEEVSFEGVKGAQQSSRRNLLFLLDNSGSMEEPPPRGTAGEKFKTKWEAALWAIHVAIKDVPEDDNLALYAFNGRGAREVVPFGMNNREAFLKELDKLSTDQGTPLCGSIRECADALLVQYKKQLGNGEFRLIVATDGEQKDGSERDLAESVKYTTRKRIQIYTIGFCTSPNHPLRKRTFYSAANSAEELKESLQKAFAEEAIDDTALPEGK